MSKAAEIDPPEASLNAEGLKPKPRRLTNGRTVAAACYRVGPLAHLLKNRFYVGEVAYLGEIHPGEHKPILDRAPFDAVRTRLKEQAVQRSAVHPRRRLLPAASSTTA